MSQWIGEYLSTRYVDGARGPFEWDCWGLVRHVRAEHLGCRLLPSFGDVRSTQPRQFTEAYRQEAELMELCAAEPGAIACVKRGPLCTHVGVVVEVDGTLGVLEMSPRVNCRWLPLDRWAADHNAVEFYRDRP